MTPAISIATPTYRREALLRLQYRTVARQVGVDLEWLVLDDSPEPSAYFLDLDDPRVHYHHHAGPKLSIGAKRNWLAERARAPIIAQFDDDDFYSPDYLARMAARLAAGADFVKLSAWFVYSAPHQQLGYWDTAATRGLHFRFARKAITTVMLTEQQSRDFETHYAGFGFSYVYRKAVWEATPFEDVDFNEDMAFANASVANGFRFEHFGDTDGLCLHILRRDNTAICYPQYVLPSFFFTKLFPADIVDLVR
jgi:glycosyltransferase involved in cell wall biosynthesis